jgi:nucleoid-associated protein YgaU
MRAREFVSEEVIKADIDWQQWAASMALAAIQQDLPRGLDAIMYLGIIGDPRRTTMNVRLDGPAKIGLDFSKKGQGYLSGTAVGQYFQSGPRAQNGDPDSVREFDILLNFNGDSLDKWVKKENMYGDFIGHELQHRGMEIVANIGAIQDKIPERSKFVFQDGNRARKIIPSIGFNAYELDTQKGDYRATFNPNDSNLEHMLLYSLWATNSGEPGREKYAEQVKKYRQIYFDIEGAAKDYVLSYPIPPGSLAALRNELEGKAPDGYKLVIGKDLRGRPTYALQSENPAAVQAAAAIAATPATAEKPVAPVATAEKPVAPVATAEKPVAPVATAEKPVAPAAAEKPTAATTPKTYTVQRGDILSRLAQRFYNGRLSDLLRANPQFTANGRNPNLIFPGDRVVIPG